MGPSGQPEPALRPVPEIDPLRCTGCGLCVTACPTRALALWPEIAGFKPLHSCVRSALFVLVPALGATAVFAWLVQRAQRPVTKFVALVGLVLLVSFIHDYLLPDPNRTLPASTVAAAVITVILVGGLGRPRSR